MSVPQSGVFEVFSINFACSFPQTARGNKYLLVCVEHLTGLPIVAAIKRATVEIVVEFLKENIIIPFGPPGLLVNDNATCFTAGVVQSLMLTLDTRWKTVLAYAPMSTGLAERMTATIKRSVARVVADSDLKWDAAVSRVVFGYCRRSNRKGLSPFELLYGVKPKMIPTDS